MFGMFLFPHFSQRLGNRYFSFPLQSSVLGKWLYFSFIYLCINLYIYYFTYFHKEVCNWIWYRRSVFKLHIVVIIERQFQNLEDAVSVYFDCE